MEDLTDAESYFEAVEDFSQCSLQDLFKNSLSIAKESVDFNNENNSPVFSNLMKSTIMPQGFHTDSAHLDIPDLYRENSYRHVSCNTELSWLSKSLNHKESQTTSSKTQDASVNTDTQLTNRDLTTKNLKRSFQTDKNVPKSVSDCHPDKNNVGIVQGKPICKLECKIPGQKVQKSVDETKSVNVHVGNLERSITESELMLEFQNYQVSKVFFQEQSSKSRFAILTFDNYTLAQSAVNEMDGKELRGRNIKVHVIKDSKCSLKGASSDCTDSARQMATPIKANHTAPQQVLGCDRSKEMSWNTQKNRPVPYPPVVQRLQPVPSFVDPTSFNPISSVPPYMVQSFLSSIMTFSALNNPLFGQCIVPYAQYRPPGPAWPPFPNVSPMKAKPVQNQCNFTQCSSLNSGSTTTFSKDQMSHSAKPVDSDSKYSEIRSSDVLNSRPPNSNNIEPVTIPLNVKASVKVSTSQT
ncbi:hypothetical protein GDO86_017004, partial [Hymenochirus boettgeri]